MALIQVNYLSKALFRTVPFNVILPVDKIDYATGNYTNKGRKFKTLYLLHGLLGNYTDWVSGTRIERWAQERNLAVIMPSGDNSFYYNKADAWSDYETFIGEELPEVMRRMFPLSEKREDNFIAGLSMGGYGAIRNGIVFSNTFSHIAGLSAAIHFFDKNTREKRYNKTFFLGIDAPETTKLNPEVAFKQLLDETRPVPEFYLACGTKDDLFSVNEDFREFLRSNGATVTWDQEDAGHEWDFWDSQIKKVLDWLPLGEAENGVNSGNVKRD